MYIGLDFINLTTKCLQIGITMIMNTISVTSTTLLFCCVLQINTLVCKSYVVKFIEVVESFKIISFDQ